MKIFSDNFNDSCLPHFPAGLPDEHIASRVIRFHIRNGNSGSLTTFRMLFDRLPFSLTHFVQPYLRELAAKLPGDNNVNLKVIEDNSTLIPLFQQFYGTAPQNAPITGKVVLSRRVVGAPGQTRICTHCLQEDEAKFGTPYLHRSHQIPGVTACWRHEIQLLESCPDCGCPYSLPKELITTAWLGCSCGLTTKDLIDRPTKKPKQIEQELAKFAQALLASPPITLDQAQMSELYRRRAKEMGLNWGAFRVSRKKLGSAIISFFGKDFLMRIDPAFRNKRTGGWLKVFEESSTFETPIHRHIFISFYLFRTYEAFRHAANDMLASTTCSGHAALPPAKRRHENAAAELLNQLERIARINHYEIKHLWINHAGSMKKLARIQPNAPRKLELKLSKLKNSSTAHSKPRTQVLVPHEDDKRWAEEIRATAARLYASTDRPFRLTRNQLIERVGFRPKGHKYPAQVLFPLAYTEWQTQAEGIWHFYARRIVWKLQTLVDAQTPDYIVIRSAGLECYKGRAVLKHLEDCPRRKGCTEGSVLTYLNTRKIGFDWEGPSPERKFDNPGRRYHLRTDRIGTPGAPIIRRARALVSRSHSHEALPAAPSTA